MSTSMTADQAAALNGLTRETRAIMLDVAEDDYASLRVVTYHELVGAHEDDGALEARWWSISVAGSIREQAATPTELAA
jgi:hypothetical protein